MTAELAGGVGAGGASGGVVGTSSITMSVMEKKEGGVLKGGEDILLHELFLHLLLHSSIISWWLLLANCI